MTDETPAEFNLDNALESAFDKMESPDVKDTPEPAAESAVKEEKPEESGEVQSGEVEKVEAEKPIDAPTSWTAEAKENFTKLPPDLQKYVAQRESDREKLITQKSMEHSEQQRKYQALEQILSPRSQALASTYGSEAQAIDQLFKLSDYADSDPAGFIQWFAQQRGIDMQQLTTGAESSDPVTMQLQKELQGIKQKLTTQEQTQMESRKKAVQDEIVSFKDAKDEKGNLLRPFFEEVRPQMAQIMNGGAAKDLNHAYEMAVWANPTIRERMMGDKKAAEDAKRLSDAKAAAAKADKAKGVTVKSKKADAAASKATSWEETLDEAAEELYGTA